MLAPRSAPVLSQAYPLGPTLSGEQCLGAELALQDRDAHTLEPRWSGRAAEAGKARGPTLGAWSCESCPVDDDSELERLQSAHEGAASSHEVPRATNIPDEGVPAKAAEQALPCMRLMGGDLSCPAYGLTPCGPSQNSELHAVRHHT